MNDPYGRLSTSQIDFKINKRSYFNFNKYELSKCCADYSIQNILKNNKKVLTFILQPSVVIEKKSKLIKKVFLFLLLFPFRFSFKSTPPITRIEYLISNLDFKNEIEYLSQKLHYWHNASKIQIKKNQEKVNEIIKKINSKTSTS